MKSNEEWSSQLCSLAQRVRAQTSHPLTKSLSKIRKIRRSPRQEKCESCLPKGQVGIQVSLSPLMSLTYCHTVSYRSWSDLRFCWHLLWTSLGASFFLQKIPHNITSYSIYNYNKGYVFGKYCSTAITYSVCGFSW